MLDKVHRAYGAQSPDKITLKKSRLPAGEGGEGDAVTVSVFARELSSAVAELSRGSEVREARVEDLRERIQSGTYQPDLRTLAARLVWAGVLGEARE